MGGYKNPPAYKLLLMEEWRDIKGYEDLYMVSDLGRVKSLERVVVGKDGRDYHVPERILKLGLGSNGYQHAILHKNDVQKTNDIHVLVAVAFLGHAPDNGKNIPHHINGDKTNNRVDNLEIISAREHASHHAINNSTGETNIYLTREGTFRVEFWFGPVNRLIYIGTYETIEEAIIIRDEKLAEVEAGTFVPRPVRTYSSKYCCVSWNKQAQKWRAVVKGKFLGYFEDEEEAHQAVLKYKALRVKPGIF